jgi:hypothetical protein
MYSAFKHEKKREEVIVKKGQKKEESRVKPPMQYDDLMGNF